MRMLQHISIVALVATLPLCVASEAFAKDAKDIVIAVIPKVAVPFFDDCNKGAAAAAKADNVQYQWLCLKTRRGRRRLRSSKT